MDKIKNKVKRIYEKNGFKVCLSAEKGVYLPLLVRDSNNTKITPIDSNWEIVKKIHNKFSKEYELHK